MLLFSKLWLFLVTVVSSLSQVIGSSCADRAPGPVSTYDLAQFLNPPVRTDAADIEAIRQTVAIYPLAIDGRNFGALRKIFTEDARVNYSDPIGVLNGVQAVIDGLPPGLLIFASTQHLYGSQYIGICNATSAVSVTYFQVSSFFVPYDGKVLDTVNKSQVFVDRGQYQDVWARQVEGTWKITNRYLVRMALGQ